MDQDLTLNDFLVFAHGQHTLPREEMKCDKDPKMSYAKSNMEAMLDGGLKRCGNGFLFHVPIG
jgi:hypothetical protein